MHFMMFSLREARWRRSKICSLKDKRRSNVIPRYLKLGTRGILSPPMLRGEAGVTCLRCRENITVADLVVDISRPHRAHQL